MSIDQVLRLYLCTVNKEVRVRMFSSLLNAGPAFVKLTDCFVWESDLAEMCV